MDLDDSELYWTRKQNNLVDEEETERYIRSLEKRVYNLEQIEKEHKKQNGELQKKIKELEEYIEKNKIKEKLIKDNYIPKSLVREKRKEIYDFIDSSQGYMAQEDLYREWGKIEMCDELLQEGDK